MSDLLRRGAFLLTAMFVVPLVVFTVAQVVEDVGGWWGAVVVVLAVAVVAVLSYLAAVRPGTTARWLGVGVALLAAYVVAESFYPGEPAGSAAPIGMTVLAMPLAVLGLRRTGKAGALLLADGMVPLLSLLVLSGMSIERTGVRLASSSEFLGIPVFIGGVFFLLAWVVRSRQHSGRHTSRPRAGLQDGAGEERHRQGQERGEHQHRVG